MQLIISPVFKKNITRISSRNSLEPAAYTPVNLDKKNTVLGYNRKNPSVIKPLEKNKLVISLNKKPAFHPDKHHAIAIYQQFESMKKLNPGSELVNRFNIKV